MKYLLTSILTLLLFTNIGYSANRHWVANANSNWNNPANWSTTNGGAGGASVPVAGDFVFFNANGSGNCTLDINVSFDGISTLNYVGIIDLNGFTFNPSVGGTANCTFSKGTITDGTGTQTLSYTTVGNTRFDNGVIIDIPVNITSGRFDFNGGVFNQVVDIIQTGSVSNYSGLGGNTFNSTFKISNNGDNYFLMGYTNPDVFNDNVTLINTGTKYIALAHNSIGNIFNGNIIFGSTNGTGVYIGNSSTASSTLAASKTIQIDAIGFSVGDLRLRGLTQVGNTPQFITLTGTARIYNYDSNWGGDVTFIAPSFFIKGTTYKRTSYLEKIGASNAVSDGGNTFLMNCELRNSGSGYFLMGSANPDTWQADLLVNNLGTYNMYIAHNSLGNTVGGSLTINQATSGVNNAIYVASGIASDIVISGLTTVNANSTATTSNVYLGSSGDVTLNNGFIATNNSTGDNSTIIVANGTDSQVIINGTTSVTNNGTGNAKRFYIGYNGDVTFNGLLTINNNSSATSSQVFCNYGANSTCLYNDNIIVTSTDANCDGVYFGNGGGIGTLAATKTVTIGGGGFIARDLQFRNFTQVGNTTQALTCTGTARIYNYDSNWGGDITFIAPRMITRGTTYNRTSYLEKNGASNDWSDGGNTFVMNCELRNSGSGYFLMGGASPDTWQANLLMNNLGTYNMYIAHNSLGNTIAGDFTLNQLSSGTDSRIYIATSSTSDLAVTGLTIINANSTATTSYVHLGREGDITLNSDLTISHSSTGTNSYVDVASGSSSFVTINGSTTVNHSATGGTTKNIFLGNSGDVTFNGTLSISNSSTATNSRVYCHYNNASTCLFNDNIIVENTTANSDGVFFGQNTGSGTLAATKTITIGAGGFVAGYLKFRNFTQVGNTTQSLTCTGTTILENWDSNWGGDVTFISPRMFTRGTTYNRTSYLEKTGASNDASAGGNTFTMNCELRNTGSGYFLMGNGNPDTWQANLLMNNLGTYNMYIAYNSLGNSVDGTLTINHTTSGTGYTSTYIASGTSSDIVITGLTTINSNSTATNSNVYLGSSGDVTLNNNLIATNNSTGTNSTIIVANGTDSQVIINGTTSVTNNGAGNAKRFFIGYNGDVTLNGLLTINNNSSATSSQVFCNYGANSTGLYNDNIVVTSTDANCDGVYFGNAGGNGTLAATKTVTIGGGGFIAGDLQFRNFTQVGNTTQALTCTGTARIYNYDSNWGGDITFIAPRMITRGTTYNRTSYLEKTGLIDDSSYGGNTFVMDNEIRNTGGDYIVMGNNVADTWQANLLVNNLGGDRIFIANNSLGNTVAGTVTVNQSTTSGTNTATLFANGSNSDITINGNVTILNNSSAPTSNVYLGNGGDVTINANLSFTSNTTSTNSNNYIADDASSTFIVNGNTTIVNNGGNTTKRIYIGSSGDVTFNGTLDISNYSTASNSQIYLNHGVNSVGTYNDNITIENTTSSSDGVFFGLGNGTGTLANGKTITIAAGGFVAGDLYFRNFTQVGGTPQVLQPTGTTKITNRDSQWNGNVDFRSPRHFTVGTIYNGTALLEKNGVSGDASTGGNIFNGTTIIRNTSTGYFMPSNTTPNDFNANVTYVKTNTGLLYPGYNCADTYANDITVDANSTVRFGAASNGRVIFDGTIAQSINVVGATPTPEFRDIETQNPNAEITLNTPIIVLVELDLQQGNLISSATNLIYANDNSIVSNVSDNAFVDGPLEKIGNDAYIFPVGKAGVYRPIEISSPSSGAARFRGEFFANDVVNDGIPDLPVEPTIHHVSDCEYWILDRIATTNAVNVTLSYKNYAVNNCSGVVSQPDLKVARWDGTIWRDHGNGGTTGTPANGTVVTSAPVTSFSPFTLATLTDVNPLPIELLEFTATNNKNVVDLHWQTASEVNNDYFTVERSANGEEFEPILKQDGAGNSSSIINYYDTDKNPFEGTSYYRLKQTDYDGTETYSGIVSVYRKNNTVINIYPNPVNDVVNVSVNKSNYTVNVYGLDGKLIYTDVNPKQIDMSTFANGIYQVVIISDDQILETIKVVKQ